LEIFCCHGCQIEEKSLPIFNANHPFFTLAITQKTDGEKKTNIEKIKKVERINGNNSDKNKHYL
jgi:hypothetical protein